MTQILRVQIMGVKYLQELTDLHVVNLELDGSDRLADKLINPVTSVCNAA